MCTCSQKRHSLIQLDSRSHIYVWVSWALVSFYCGIVFVWNLHLKIIICFWGKEAIPDINYTLKRWLFLKVWAEEQQQQQLDHRSVIVRLVSVSKLLTAALLLCRWNFRREEITFCSWLHICWFALYVCIFCSFGSSSFDLARFLINRN